MEESHASGYAALLSFSGHLVVKESEEKGDID